MKKKQQNRKTVGHDTGHALPPWISEHSKGAVLHVHVVPRASATAFAGIHGERLKIKVQAPPVDGAANKSIEKFLIKNFSLNRKSVVLTSGARSRQKSFLLMGITPVEVLSMIKNSP